MFPCAYTKDKRKKKKKYFDGFIKCSKRKMFLYDENKKEIWNSLKYFIDDEELINIGIYQIAVDDFEVFQENNNSDKISDNVISNDKISNVISSNDNVISNVNNNNTTTNKPTTTINTTTNTPTTTTNTTNNNNNNNIGRSNIEILNLLSNHKKPL
ncbi:hypothetical protein NUSPORA_02329 [Nucleospora cyclopteri]